MSYDLFRGPDPRHYGNLRTYDEWWSEVLWEKWLHTHIVVSKPEFVGAMPVRVDLEVEPLRDKVERLGFRAWENVGMTIRWVRPAALVVPILAPCPQDAA